MNQEKPVNFYFGSLKDSNVVSDTNRQDKHQDYIILQNDFFHKKVEELTSDLNELRKEKEELEDENESLEISKTSLKSYIKNEGEYNRLSKELVKNYNDSLIKNSILNKQIIRDSKIFFSAFFIFEFSIIFFKLYKRDIVGIAELIIINFLIVYIFMKIYESYSKFNYIEDIHKDLNIIKIKHEISRAEKGNDYLNELVDFL